MRRIKRAQKTKSMMIIPLLPTSSMRDYSSQPALVAPPESSFPLYRRFLFKCLAANMRWISTRLMFASMVAARTSKFNTKISKLWVAFHVKRVIKSSN
jgi:hypothetical protein